MNRDIYVVSVPRGTFVQHSAEGKRNLSREEVRGFIQHALGGRRRRNGVKVFIETRDETRHKLVDTLLRGRAMEMRKKRRPK